MEEENSTKDEEQSIFERAFQIGTEWMGQLARLKVDEKTIGDALDWAYTKSINGAPGMPSVEELADEYLKKAGTLEEKIDSIINWQVSKCAATGFVTGLGGFMVMPITVPANISSVLYIQIRMIAAIAYMCGHDVKEDKVRALVLACLCGNAALEALRDAGVVIGVKLTTQALKNLSGQIIIRINKAVGFRLLTKFGQTGTINIAKGIPIIGGIIGATFDAVSTVTIGKVAKSLFLAEKIAEDTAEDIDIDFEMV